MEVNHLMPNGSGEEGQEGLLVNAKNQGNLLVSI
jgi:hypothetical protein